MRRQPTAQSLIALLITGSLTSSFAAGPSIGIAMASGPFRIDNSEVKGNASLFEGSELRTNAASSKVRISSGARLEISIDSQLKVFSTHSILERGAGQVEGALPYNLEARTLRVSGAAARSIGRVRLDGATAVLVSAVNGPVRVSTSTGRLIATLDPGRSLRFEPQAAAADTFEVTGCLLKKNGRSIVVDQTTGQYFEVRGLDSTAEYGNRVTVKGKSAPGSPIPVQGAAQIIVAQSLDAVAPGGCLATASSVGADPPPGATSAPEALKVPPKGTNKAIVYGVIIAGGAGAGIAVALAGGSKSK